ncbi:MAG: hypothetical protein NC038_01100 [Paludibacter sp.]|nr:hypothetical protein [Prevotella sp.]MCM1481231.1 hypothetical protein [Paludibacter sp.]MCM1575693.1 hypothetical protein [Bacteroides sp.]
MTRMRIEDFFGGMEAGYRIKIVCLVGMLWGGGDVMIWQLEFCGKWCVGKWCVV